MQPARRVRTPEGVNVGYEAFPSLEDALEAWGLRVCSALLLSSPIRENLRLSVEGTVGATSDASVFLGLFFNLYSFVVQRYSDSSSSLDLSSNKSQNVN